jgi:hypothetical protein
MPDLAFGRAQRFKPDHLRVRLSVFPRFPDGIKKQVQQMRMEPLMEINGHGLPKSHWQRETSMELTLSRFLQIAQSSVSCFLSRTLMLALIAEVEIEKLCHN